MRLIAFLLFLFVFFTSFSQEKTLLYKISKEGHQESYVYGTMHILPDSLFYFPNKLKKTVKKSEELILEIDEKSVSQKEILKLMALESGSAFDIFTKEQKDSVLNWGSKLTGLTPALFESTFSKQEPFALMQLSVLETMKQPHKMVEKELEVIARENNIPTSGLESIAFQLSIFKDLPDSLLSDMILQTIRTSGDYTETLKLYTAYKNQDVELLYELINEDEQLADKEAVLLSNRNEDWIPKIDAKTKEKKCFFAVGAGHLGGEKGVLNLLRKQGYTVEAITY
ncbi:MAG: TraB/GumN family protein [Fluviicola sp.]|jgi:uncharacterized protein YbaP (TraB family)